MVLRKYFLTFDWRILMFDTKNSHLEKLTSNYDEKWSYQLILPSTPNFMYGWLPLIEPLCTLVNPQIIYSVTYCKFVMIEPIIEHALNRTTLDSKISIQKLVFWMILYSSYWRTHWWWYVTFKVKSRLHFIARSSYCINSVQWRLIVLV